MTQSESIIARAAESAADGDMANAEHLCRTALDADPQNCAALDLAARLALNRDDRDVALRFATAALDGAPGNPAYLQTLARAHAVSGSMSAAISALESALEADPSDILCRCELGRFLLSANRSDEALVVLETACKSAPDRPEPVSYLALVLFHLGRGEEAVATADRALSMGEDRPGPLAALGKNLQSAKAYRAARNAFERAIALNPDDLDSRAGLSRACARLGDRPAAVQAARALFRQCPLYSRETGDPARRVLVLECLYDGYFPERRYGADIFRYMNFVSGLEPGVLSLHHYYLNRDDPVADLKQLGRFDVIVNNLVNGELLTEHNLAPLVGTLIDAAGIPALNPPDAVLATTRVGNYQRLRHARGFTFPKTVAISVEAGGIEAAARRVLAEMPLPVILRPARTHAGKRAVLVTNDRDLKPALAGLAGKRIYAIAYTECRNADGMARRYRLVAVGKDLIPVNMHAAEHWNVHGDERTDEHWLSRGYDREERAFLDDPASVLGGDPHDVFGDILRNTPLDIYGFDFAILPSGEIIVFEVNSAMSFSTRKLLKRYPYLRPYHARSQRLIEAYIETRIRAARPTAGD